MSKSAGKPCGWKHPRAPSFRVLFQHDRATPAVLTLLRETKFGRMTSLHPGEEEREGGIAEEEGVEGGPGPP